MVGTAVWGSNGNADEGDTRPRGTRKNPPPFPAVPACLSRIGASSTLTTTDHAAPMTSRLNYRDLGAEAAQQELQQDPTLRVLDVRTEHEYRSHRLPDATLVPIQDLAQRLQELDRDTNWLVYCAHGRRSVFACDLLAKAGFTKLSNLRGGLAAWVGCGLPLENTKKH